MNNPMYFLGPWPWFDDEAGGHWGPPPGCRGAIDLASAAQIAAATPGQPRGAGIFACEALPSDLTEMGGVALASGDLCDARPNAKLLDGWQSITGYRPGGDTLAACLWDQLTTGADPAHLDRAGPLVPDAHGRLQLRLGGLVREERFEYGRHPCHAALKDFWRRHLRRVREDALAGRFRDARGRVDFERHLKFADALVEKFAGRNPAAKAALFADLRPDDWGPTEILHPHETTLSDDFNRADNTDISAGGPLSWNEVQGDMQISSQVIVSTAGVSRSRAETDLSAADLYAQALCGTGSTSTTRTSGPMARYAAGANTAYYAAQAGGASGSGTFRPAKVVAGTLTNLGTGSSQTQNAVKRLECSGSTISIFSGGALAESITDTSIDGVTVGGLRCGMGIVTTSSAHTLDDFEAGDLLAAILYTRLERGIRGLRRGLVSGSN